MSSYPVHAAEPAGQEVIGFRWNLEVKNTATNEVKNYAFTSPGDYQLQTVAPCTLTIYPAKQTKARFQNALVSCSDGHLAVNTLAFCGENTSAVLTSENLTVGVAAAKKADPPRFDHLTLQCEGGNP
jgi:hypothetical protein